MTKIEEFKKQKLDHDSMERNSLKALNVAPFYSSNRDKYGVELGTTWHDHGEKMGVLTAYQGFYGSSSCTYEGTPRLAKYLQIAINKNMESLVRFAISLSEQDVEKVRISAEDEAKSVLKQTITP